jgi:branched-chain amino acid transport system ATP-binding protein
LIAQLKDSQRYAIVLVEHKLEVVMRLSTRVAVLHQGELLTEGSPEQVMANPEVERAYLGGRHDSSA